MDPHPQQQRYIDSLLKQSEEDLLYEVARGLTSRITASARPLYETKSDGSGSSRADRIKSQRNNVPVSPITEFHKPSLRPYLDEARQQVNRLHSHLYQLMCDMPTLKPNEQALDIATGSTKDFIVAIISSVLIKHGEALAIAIPATVLLLKKGLFDFCAIIPENDLTAS